MPPDVNVELRDGAPVRIREVDGSDRPALLAGFERLSPESRVRRFFTAMPRLTGPVVDGLTAVDHEHHVAIGAFDPHRQSDVGTTDGLGIGVARYIVYDDDPTSAEAAIAVIDEYQGRGIGTLLLEALLVIARERGVDTFVADVLADNATMVAMFARMGAAVTSDFSDPEIVRFAIDVSDAEEPLRSTATYGVLRALAARDLE